MTEEESILKTITPQLKSAVQWSNSAIANKQETALKFYKREPIPGDENPKVKNKSKYVDAHIQQSIDWLTAQLLRIFDTPENVVEFTGFGDEDEAIARQQTRIVNWVMKTVNRHEVYMTQWIQTGYLTGLGILTVEFDVNTEETLPRLLKNVPNEMLVVLNQQEEAGQIIIEEVGKPQTQPGPMGFVETRDVKIRKIKRKPCFNILPVAPEDFLVSKEASFDPETGGIAARIQGHRKLISKSELLEMGFEADKVNALPAASDKTDGIALERSKDLAGERGVGPDDVEIFQVYTKAKLGKDKKARHYRLTIGGDIESRPVLLDYTEVSKFYPYAAFTPHQLSNTLFGLGEVDRLHDEHIYLTRTARAQLNNLQDIVNPTRLVKTGGVDLDDLMNPHPDAIVRVDELDAITYVTPPYIGQQAMQVADSIAKSVEMTTGVGPSMMAVDASDLQRTSATAANIRSNSQQTLIEGTARWFAGTGYSYLVKIIVDLLVSKPDEAQELIARLTNGENIPLDQFDPEFDLDTSIGFGVMSRDQSAAQLTNFLALQQQAGPVIAGPQQQYATLAKFAETSGLKNIGMFLNDPSTTPPAPPAPPPLTEADALRLQAELNAQSDELKRQFEMQKFVAEMDLKRDQMAQEFALKQAEIEAKYAAHVEVERLKLEQNMVRDPITGHSAAAVAPAPVNPMVNPQ
ncbi:portal protein [Sinorhizobium meliloti]|uniref:portal protein n=1 Tax=Rhizobium meliloti TaxID=382 RepID=UPI00299E91DF